MHAGSPQLCNRLVPSRDALAARVDGLLVVLDLRREQYSIFDEVATTMWTALEELGERDRVVERLRNVYDVDPARLEGDLDAFIARLIEGGFARWGAAERETVFETASTRTRPARRGMLELRAWRTIADTVFRLRRDGFARTYRRAAGAAAETVVEQRYADVLLQRGLRAFSRAENAFLIRSAPRDCLPRSLALFRFLRAIGVPAEHRIGVTRFPFRAHAWAECDGRVLLDHSGLVARFTAVARLPR